MIQQNEEETKRIENLFSNKKSKDKNLMKFDGKADFVKWYKQAFAEQEESCHYCGTKESQIAELINAGILSSKRFKKRGHHLEVERKNANTNEYSRENSILACYFCNKHKSDIISYDDHMELFAPKIGEYLTNLYNKHIAK